MQCFFFPSGKTVGKNAKNGGKTPWYGRFFPPLINFPTVFPPLFGNGGKKNIPLEFSHRYFSLNLAAWPARGKSLTVHVVGALVQAVFFPPFRRFFPTVIWERWEKKILAEIFPVGKKNTDFLFLESRGNFSYSLS